LKTLLRGYGARVLDLDTLLQRNDFLDNDHLTADGQRRLADALQPALPHGLAERAVHLANDR
ncbi:MAG: hypothetical protein IAI50_11105, partial [Candidatus Eremiobacteraeota bacterium]|nr:hypothetical protein [Candidatus Eremiobacteraeota bacterium]